MSPPTSASGGNDDDAFTEEMHYRASILAAVEDMHIPHDKAPADSREGMTRREESMKVDEAIAKSAAELNASASDRLLKPESAALTRTSSQAFREGEVTTIQRVLDEVDKMQHEYMKKGMKEFNFTLGVLNCFLVTYTFGALPQHFWLLYLVEGLYLIPKVGMMRLKAKPLNEALYYLDFCWMMNFIGLAALMAFAAVHLLVGDITYLPHDVRKHAFLTMVGVAGGPLLGATAALPFVCVLFHDLGSMTNLTIHIFPPMVLYTFLWHTDAIREAWSHVFELNYLDDVRFFPQKGGVFFLPGTGLDSIAGSAVALYWLWFAPYLAWMLLIGLDLPRSDRKNRNGEPIVPKYDTVFHSLMRGGAYIVFGSVFWKRSKEISLEHMSTNHYELRDFLIYMAMHLLAVMCSIYTLGYACYSSQVAHGILLILVSIICVARGAKRYTYYTTMMYGRKLRKQFANRVASEEEAKAKKTK